MSIRLSIKKMESLLAIPAEKRNMRWAHDVCTASRFIHIDVWKFCAEREYVKTKVIPLLRKAKRELGGLLGKKSFDEKKIGQYAQNDELRIENLEENYLNGKPSGFRPDHKLSEPESNVG